MATRAMTYPLGRPVVPATLVRRMRPLPAGAIPQVGIGEQVRPEQQIAEIPAGQHGGAMAVLAGMAGRVIEVLPGRHITLEGVATLVHGIVGAGAPVVGPLAMLPRGESLAVVPIPRGAIIVYPQTVPLTLLQRAAAGGALGIIAASASAREFESFIRADLSAVLDGLIVASPYPPFTVVLTEGLGAAPMQPNLYHVLSQRIQDTALVSGATNHRRTIRPEIVLPQPLGTPTVAVPFDCTIVPGARVTVTAGQHRGLHGEIIYVYTRPQRVEQGLLVPCASVRSDDGASVMIPLRVLDRIG